MDELLLGVDAVDLQDINLERIMKLLMTTNTLCEERNLHFWYSLEPYLLLVVGHKVEEVVLEIGSLDLTPAKETLVDLATLFPGLLVGRPSLFTGSQDTRGGVKSVPTSYN